jgi:hypothetical protein
LSWVVQNISTNSLLLSKKSLHLIQQTQNNASRW